MPTWLGFAARHVWLAELATHFTWQYCWVLPAPLIASVWLRRKRLAVFVAVTLAVNLAAVAPLYWPPASPAAQTDAAPQLRVLSLNVWKKNRRHDDVVKHIRRESPDLFVLFEVNRRLVDAMQPLAADYPHQHVQLAGTRSGVALFSKQPLSGVRFERLGPIDRFVLVAEFDLGGRPATLIGLHPSLPRRPQNVQWRNAELLAAARLAAGRPGPVIMVGDLTTTPWSPVFGDVLKAGRLRNSQRGYGVQPTWSYQGRRPLLLPIDHALHSEDLVVVGRRVGPFVGSDHRALTVDFLLPAAD
ncbi:MAG: endonuclease/exonuclease/phosphatase family protein [Planctomycetota bacterium]